MATQFEEISVSFFKMTWQQLELLDTLAKGNEKVNDAIMAALEYKAPEVEAHMKQNAPWTDQTGNARQGLRAQAYDLGGDQKGIILYHQVPYGIWLEVKNSGEYGIILDTIQIMGPEVMKSLENIIGRLRFT